MISLYPVPIVIYRGGKPPNKTIMENRIMRNTITNHLHRSAVLLTAAIILDLFLKEDYYV
jgi:hypothetical protein